MRPGPGPSGCRSPGPPAPCGAGAWPPVRLARRRPGRLGDRQRSRWAPVPPLPRPALASRLLPRSFLWALVSPPSGRVSAPPGRGGPRDSTWTSRQIPAAPLFCELVIVGHLICVFDWAYSIGLLLPHISPILLSGLPLLSLFAVADILQFGDYHDGFRVVALLLSSSLWCA